MSGPTETPSPCSTQQSDPRIDGQYLQAIVAYWVHINTVNWQRLAAILIIQTGSLSTAFAQRPSWMSIGILLGGWLLSVFLLFAIRSDQDIRTELTKQANYLSERLLSPLLEERALPEGLKAPFRLYDLGKDSKEPMIRSHTAVRRLIWILAMIDLGLAAAFNYGDQILGLFGLSTASPFLGIPLIKH